MTTRYRAYCEGFSRSFDDLDALKAWAIDLRARYGLAGCELKIWKALAITGAWTTYDAMPSRVIML